VFSRDADAICDISSLSPSKELLELISSQMQDGEKPMQISFVLRDFKDIEPINIWFRFPLHFIDDAGLLDGAPVKGSRQDNLNQSPNRTTPAERKATLDSIYQVCESEGMANVSDMIEYGKGIGVAESTLRRYIKEFDNEYETVKRGFIHKK
jgi:hypothetical protein